MVLWGASILIIRANKSLPAATDVYWISKVKQKLAERSGPRAICKVFMYPLVLALVIAWARIHMRDASASILNADYWGRSVIQGLLLGFALFALLPIVRLLSGNRLRFRFPFVVNAGSALWIRACISVAIVASEELWRAVCIRATTSIGLTTVEAVVLTSLVYGLAYVPWGARAAISATYLGVAYALLFVRSGSIVVPFTAHLLMQGITLYYITMAGPTADSGWVEPRHYTKCPACNAELGLRQVNLNFNEAFACPPCHARITVSDRRRGILRWGITLLFVAFFALAVYVVRPDAPDLAVACFMLALFSGLGASVFLSTVIPPRLEYGDPDFVSLNLTGRMK
jgi:membrane protease YdiL (CAAX protease family)